MARPVPSATLTTGGLFTCCAQNQLSEHLTHLLRFARASPPVLCLWCAPGSLTVCDGTTPLWHLVQGPDEHHHHVVLLRFALDHHR
jgi:hypothetical protein